MERLAGILVIIGTALLFAASEAVDDLFFGGFVSRRLRNRVPRWMRFGLVTMLVGVALIVAGIGLLHFRS